MYRRKDYVRDDSQLRHALWAIERVKSVLVTVVSGGGRERRCADACFHSSQHYFTTSRRIKHGQKHKSTLGLATPTTGAKPQQDDGDCADGGSGQLITQGAAACRPVRVVSRSRACHPSCTVPTTRRSHMYSQFSRKCSNLFNMFPRPYSNLSLRKIEYTSDELVIALPPSRDISNVAVGRRSTAIQLARSANVSTVQASQYILHAFTSYPDRVNHSADGIVMYGEVYNARNERMGQSAACEETGRPRREWL